MKTVKYYLYSFQIYNLLIRNKPDYTPFSEIANVVYHFGKSYPPPAGQAYYHFYKDYLSDWERRGYLEIKYQRSDYIYNAFIKLSVKGEDELSIKGRVRLILPYVSFFSLASGKELFTYLSQLSRWIIVHIK